VLKGGANDRWQYDPHCYPTATFKAPMIYNPYFQNAGINAAVMTMGVKGED
jgi:hypothetical protein